jgi:hypothetical protein
MVNFFNCSPTLEGTKFRECELLAARDTYRAMFADVDQQWPSQPVGPLASYWKRDDRYSVSYLIHVAKTLRLLSFNVSDASMPILRQKAKELLRPPSESAFEEILIELEVGSQLTDWANPIALEPLVPNELKNSPRKPSSPDYAIRLPASEVTFEVTVWRWQRIHNWDNVRRELLKRLETKLAKFDLQRSFAIELPLHITTADLPILTSGSIVDKLIGDPGEATVETRAATPLSSGQIFRTIHLVMLRPLSRIFRAMCK